ncbi:MAG: DUF975 family protein [Clostridiales Family XIII bacterium]|jgi:hypothetical protein|nr:DUF975 family protein [Clostridiales Family XIII bacterium]
MRKRKEIKRDARRNYRRNFVSCFLACLTFVFLMGGFLGFSETISVDESVLKAIEKDTQGTPASTAIRRIIDGIEKIKDATSIGERSNAGAISAVYRSSVKAGGINNAFLSLINKTVFGGEIGGNAIGAIGAIFTIAFGIFVGGVVDIGVCRLFLETRLYPDTPFTRVLFIYREKHALNAASIVFFRYLKLALWALTIVGFPIKYYAYYLVPFIAAEKPDISRKRIFRLSAQMTRGHRFRIFLFDLSFLGWLILSVFTFGLLNYLWLNPYMRAARAELYAAIRAEAKARDLEGTDALDDALLFAPRADAIREDGVYPAPSLDDRGGIVRRWINIGAKDRYALLNLSLMFFLFSFIGWIWECSLIFIEHGVFVNRGTLYGPWIPIYGLGGIAILLLLNRLNKKPVLCFFTAILLCGAIEYAGATLLWNLHHVKYWDYSGYFFNIQGRVCLEGLLAFGTLGLVGMYLIAPLTDNLLNKIPLHRRKLLCTALFAVFGADFVFSQLYPHVGPGITKRLS